MILRFGFHSNVLHQLCQMLVWKGKIREKIIWNYVKVSVKIISWSLVRFKDHVKCSYRITSYDTIEFILFVLRIQPPWIINNYDIISADKIDEIFQNVGNYDQFWSWIENKMSGNKLQWTLIYTATSVPKLTVRISESLCLYMYVIIIGFKSCVQISEASLYFYQ